jgi:PUA domain.
MRYDRGAQLAGAGVLSCKTFAKGDTVALMTEAGECIGLGTARIPSEKCVPGKKGFVARPKIDPDGARQVPPWLEEEEQD